MTAKDMVVTDLDGQALDNRMRSSSDLDTHVVLYRAFTEMGAFIHSFHLSSKIYVIVPLPIVRLRPQAFTIKQPT